MNPAWTVVVETPLGPFHAAGDARGLTASGFGAPATSPTAGDPFGARAALAAYFAGSLDALDGLPSAAGGTPFQQTVWAELRRIPIGRTITYAELALRIGKPSATRAVGTANGRNPLGIVVPCHRVVAVDGRLGGYTGGLDRKRWLLAHEGAPGYLVP